MDAVWLYDGAVSDAIRRSKASNDPASLFELVDGARARFRELAAPFAEWNWTTPPSHGRDLRRRGWDPARAALRRAAPEIHIEAPLSRTMRATKQAHLRQNERWVAMRTAFESRPVAGDWVVFDDVMTTGATLDAVARALKGSGAERVRALVLARCA